MTPFAMTSNSQFRVPPPVSMNSPEYTADYNEILCLGRAENSCRTPEQSDIARFWAGSDVVHWNTIAQQMAMHDPGTLLDHARLFALLNITLADAVISAWDGKRYYSSIPDGVHHAGWRPVHAIPLAHQTGNPNTIPDPTWTPFLVTPAHPEYPASHPTTTGAASTLLALYFGDRRSFIFESDTLPGRPRSFTSFSQAAAEVTEARLYAGLHFRTSSDRSQKGGANIAIGLWRLRAWSTRMRRINCAAMAKKCVRSFQPALS